MPSVNRGNLSFSLNAGSIAKGSVTSLGLAVAFSLVAGLTYHFSSLPEHTLPWAAMLVLGCGSCGGAIIAGRSAGTRGLCHGLSVGLVFFLAVWLGPGVFLPGQAVLTVLEKLIAALIGGGLGGAIGVALT